MRNSNGLFHAEDCLAVCCYLDSTKISYIRDQILSTMVKLYQSPSVEEIGTFTEGLLCTSTVSFESPMDNVGREELDW